MKYKESSRSRCFLWIQLIAVMKNWKRKKEGFGKRSLEQVMIVEFPIEHLSPLLLYVYVTGSVTQNFDGRNCKYIIGCSNLTFFYLLIPVLSIRTLKVKPIRMQIRLSIQRMWWDVNQILTSL